jgi:adenosylmethionine-8-amino-7-oxononanoate aminotransferase
MVSKRTQEIIARDDKYKCAHFGVIGMPIEVVFERGRGCIIIDTEGKEYIDLCTHHQCVNLGYGRKDIHDAIMEQLGKLEFSAVVPPVTHEIVGRCGEKLVSVLPSGLGHPFFTTSGSNSVETAIRLSKFYWHVKSQPNKYKIICLQNCFHGSEVMSGALMGQPLGRLPFGPDDFGIARAPHFNCYHCPFDLGYPDCGILCARYLEKVIMAEGDDSIAAFIVEPEQGVGGCVPAPQEYFPIVEKICKEHNILLLIDEVMSGFCRTGKMFAIEYWNVKPDMMVMAKGINSGYIPFGAVAMTDEIYNTLRGNHMIHGFTYVGHPVGCASTIASIDAYVNEKVADNAAKVGAHVKERLEKEFLPLPHISYIDGLGLFLSIEIVKDKATKSRFPSDFGEAKLKPALRKVGLYPRLTSSLYGDRLYFTPACVITMAEADRAVDLMYPVLRDIDKL